MYSAVSLFTGAYGLDLGLEQAGFNFLCANEIDPKCCARLRRNLPRLRLYQADIASLNPKDVLNDIGLKTGELKLLAGGPPCQAFSTAGRRGALTDPRGNVIRNYFKFIEVMQPHFALMENVRGILSAALQHVPLKERENGKILEGDRRPGSVMDFIRYSFEEIGYSLSFVLVDAVYYGVPQTRQRVFFIAERGQTNRWTPPEPTHHYEFPGGRLPAKVYMGTGLLDRKTLKPAVTLGEAIKGLREKHPEYTPYSDSRLRFFEHLKPGENWRNLPRMMQRQALGGAWSAGGGRVGFYRRLTFDRPSPTIITSMVQKASGMCHPRNLRPLSVRECARVQQFPDDWVFQGSTLEKYRQIGNAVPIGLAKAFGESIAYAINHRKFDALRNQKRVVKSAQVE